MSRTNLRGIRGRLKARQEVRVKENFRTYLAQLMGRKGGRKEVSFFANVASGLRIKEDVNTRTFSMAIEKGHYLMRYNPQMAERLSVFGLGLVICHEMGHASLGHIPRTLRLLDRHKSKGMGYLRRLMALIHISADYALNSWLIDDMRVFTLTELKTKVGVPVVGSAL